MENTKAGPKYFVEIEGTEYPWDKDTITVAEIRQLGHLAADQPVIEIDADNNEIQLQENAVISLKPGHRFGKKIKFKRGWSDRIEGELDLLRKFYPDVEYDISSKIFVIPKYEIPSDFWSAKTVRLAFQVPAGYPGQPPYAFYIEGGVKLREKSDQEPDQQVDKKPSNYDDCPLPPFEGVWGKFSWAHENWKPTSDLSSGSNLLNFVQTFKDRFNEKI